MLVALCSLVLFTPDNSRGENLLRLHFIDVGYGNAVLVEFSQGEVMLVDAGAKGYSENVINYLKSLDIKEIDVAILTHPHYDHFGGFASLVKVLPIKRLYSNDDPDRSHSGYLETMKEIHDAGIKEIPLLRGDELFFRGEDIRVQVLHPEDLSEAKSANENSIVIWIQFGNTSFLLTSDIKPPQQNEILKIYPEIRTASSVQIPHHGGRLSDDFVRLCEGKILVLSTGPNDYGKPYPEELAKIQTKILRTDLLGTIILESNGEKVSVSGD